MSTERKSRVRKWIMQVVEGEIPFLDDHLHPKARYLEVVEAETFCEAVELVRDWEQKDKEKRVRRHKLKPLPQISPCPFCGRTPVISSEHSNPIMWIECRQSDCGQGPLRKSWRAAIIAWNQRKEGKQ